MIDESHWVITFNPLDFKQGMHPCHAQRENSHAGRDAWEKLRANQ